MSLSGKLFAGLAFFGFLILILSRIYLGGWINYLFIPLALFCLSSIGFILMEFKQIVRFFSYKVTQQGLSLGLYFLIAIFLFIAINVLGVLNNFSFDLTKNKRNTLSQQTLEVLSSLGARKVSVKSYFRGTLDQSLKVKSKPLLERYRLQLPNFEFKFINTYTDKIEAEKALAKFANLNQMITLVQVEDKVVKVDLPVSEATLTTAIIRASRSNQKYIYFLAGHGERDIMDTSPSGVSSFRAELEGFGFEVKPLSFVKEGLTLPEDINCLIVAGPQKSFLPGELETLEKYLKSGGRIVLAIDPGKDHNLRDWLQQFGVDFKNNFILAEAAEKLGRSPTSALAIGFEGGSPITKGLNGPGQMFTLFELASEIGVSSENPNWIHNPLLLSNPQSFVVDQLKLQVTAGARQARLMGVEVTEKKSEGFSLVVFGDSDFLSNKDIGVGQNSRLAMNSVSHLAKEADLIYVPPVEGAIRSLVFTGRDRNSLGIIGFFIPFLLFLLTGIIYLRRKKM